MVIVLIIVLKVLFFHISVLLYKEMVIQCYRWMKESVINLQKYKSEKLLLVVFIYIL